MSHATFPRLLKFSLIGGIGAGVQLSVLAALTALRIDYLPATVLAVECALIHNFFWHRRFTWADRAGSGMHCLIASLLRFHLSNGLISLVGNLLLMRCFVAGLRWPILRANVAAIATCFIANFLASDRWVFWYPSTKHSICLRPRDRNRPARLPLRFSAADVPASALTCVGRKEHK